MQELRFRRDMLGVKVKERRVRSTENGYAEKGRIRIFLTLVIAIVALGAVTAAFFDRMVIFAVSRYNGIETGYSRLYREAGAIVLDDLSLAENRRGVGLYCKRAVLKPALKDFFKKGLEIYFNLEDARFKKIGDSGRPSADPLSAMVLVPFEGAWRYSDIEGDLVINGRAMAIKKLDAAGKDLKFYLSGNINADDTIELSVKIYFSQNAVRQLPDEFTEAVLSDEDDTWKTLSVKLEGNYRSPGIQLTGKLFRLNITNR